MSFINSSLSSNIEVFVHDFTQDNMHYIAKFFIILQYFCIFHYSFFREKGDFVDQSADLIGSTVFVMKYLLLEIMEYSFFFFSKLFLR